MAGRCVAVLTYWICNANFRALAPAVKARFTMRQQFAGIMAVPEPANAPSLAGRHTRKQVMRIIAITARRCAVLVLAGLAMSGMSACEGGPDLARLAPTMPNLNPEIPESTRPEAKNTQFPNINNAPDRPSVMHSDDQIKDIEKSLEKEGDEHVNEAVTEITGKPPEDEGKKGKKEAGTGSKKQKGNEKADKSGTSADAPAHKPIQLTPTTPSDNPS